MVVEEMSKPMYLVRLTYFNRFKHALQDNFAWTDVTGRNGHVLVLCNYRDVKPILNPRPPGRVNIEADNNVYLAVRGYKEMSVARTIPFELEIFLFIFCFFFHKSNPTSLGCIILQLRINALSLVSRMTHSSNVTSSK